MYCYKYYKPNNVPEKRISARDDEGTSPAQPLIKNGSIRITFIKLTTCDRIPSCSLEHKNYHERTGLFMCSHFVFVLLLCVMF